MKKFLLFAAAMLGLVACNKNDLNSPIESGQKVVLHASVAVPTDDDADAKGPHRVAPNDPTAATVDFHWEAGDQIIVKNGAESQTFTVIASTISGNTADFEGTALSDMSSYDVYYGYNPDAASQSIPYKEGSFRPCVKGTGADTDFRIDDFFPVIKLQLKGDFTLGKIEYGFGGETKATMSVGGLVLNSTAKTIYLPVANIDASGFTLKFYDSSDALVNMKITYKVLASNQITTFPVIKVQAPEAIDLGLTSGTKWANMNVGALSPEDYGGFFAWGETYTKSAHTWATYKYCNGTNNTLLKYNSKASNGVVDNKIKLDQEDDAAYANWGGAWRMPTHAELVELKDNCTWTWTTENGINGYRVSKNGKSIFLPAAGQFGSLWSEMGIINVGTHGNYWTSSRHADWANGYYIYFYDTGRSYGSQGYMLGLSIRPVCN